MGENQLKAVTDADAKLSGQIKLRVMEKDKEHHMKDQQKTEKKLKAQQELTSFFEDHVTIP